ncbi:MAG: hypothetical protein IPK07_01300 [Deltaproteobacteria bacterium]|nr:hypothetical protein [Deltaproteobacteria bacterium]
MSCREPYLTLVTTRGRTVVACESSRFVFDGDPLELIDRLLERLRPRTSLGLPFEGGLVGYLGYELLDHCSTDRTDRPDAWLAFPRRMQITPEVGDTVDVTVEDLPDPTTLGCDLGCKPVDGPTPDAAGRSSGHGEPAPASRSYLSPESDARERFVTAVEDCQRLIAAGELYQANLAHHLETRRRANARELAIATWKHHPTPTRSSSTAANSSSSARLPSSSCGAASNESPCGRSREPVGGGVPRSRTIGCETSSRPTPRRLRSTS